MKLLVEIVKTVLTFIIISPLIVPGLIGLALFLIDEWLLKKDHNL